MLGARGENCWAWRLGRLVETGDDDRDALESRRDRRERRDSLWSERRRGPEGVIDSEVDLTTTEYLWGDRDGTRIIETKINTW